MDIHRCYLVQDRLYDEPQCDTGFTCSGCQGNGLYDRDDPMLIKWRVAWSDDLEMQQYLRAVIRYHEDFPDQREGQAAFNVLWSMYPDLADSIRGVPGLDPFQVTDNLPNFYKYIWARITP